MRGKSIRPGLPSSGMLVINPPHTLKAKLNEAIKQVAEFLAQSSHSTFTVESGGH